MSQHYISTGEYEILVGWDRPLQYFFGTVWKKSKYGAAHSVVFATLELPGGGVSSVDELATLLRPYSMLTDEIKEALIRDRDSNHGNVIHRWNLKDEAKGA